MVERGARIGAGTVLKARVSVGEDCVIGERCILHPGVVIGADGFGFAPDAAAPGKRSSSWARCASATTSRSAPTPASTAARWQDTVIEDGVKLDNLIQIGHNVRIGKHTAMAGCAAVAGSATIGAHCTIGGARRHPGPPDHRRPRAYLGAPRW